jgi:hypothetical protein
MGNPTSLVLLVIAVAYNRPAENAQRHTKRTKELAYSSSTTLGFFEHIYRNIMVSSANIAEL